MHFSIAPGQLDVRVFGRPTAQCGAECELSYSVADVYYAEVCVLNQVCTNGAALFGLRVGELFECAFDVARFLELREMLRG
jgi:hypothetical protein